MRGLLYKEYYLLRPQMKSWLSVLVFFLIYTFLFQNAGMLAMMLAVIGITSCYNSFHYDKQYRCDEYLAAMPVTRGQMVASKYIFIFFVDLFIALAAVAAVLAAQAGSFIDLPLGESMASLGGVLAVTILIQAVTIPLIYILGVDKARYVNVIIWMSPWVLIMLNRNRLPEITEAQIIGALKFAPIFIAFSVAVSWVISTVIFRKRDL